MGKATSITRQKWFRPYLGMGPSPPYYFRFGCALLNVSISTTGRWWARFERLVHDRMDVITGKSGAVVDRLRA
jgi:hypothetical protein